MRDGFMNINNNSGSKKNYEPNSHHHEDGPFEDKNSATKPFPVSGVIARIPFEAGDIDME
jgi:catalase